MGLGSEGGTTMNLWSRILLVSPLLLGCLYGWFQIRHLLG